MTRSNSIPAFYSGQDCSGTPDHYVTRGQADQLKKEKKARPIHRGSAILMCGLRSMKTKHKDSVKSAWKVVGQTDKKGFNGPGFPHYGSS